MNYSRIKNYWIKLGDKLKGKCSIAHHGLQRSGTNFLNSCLTELGVFPVNSYDPERTHPSHKHFRWQHDKDSIIPAAPIYLNQLYVDNIDDLNRFAGYPDKCRHVVIKKDLVEWLTSILNWGIRVNWYNSKHEALESVYSAISDYQAYYSFWERMEVRHPEYVRVVCFSKLKNNPRIIIDVIKDLGLTPKNVNDFTGRFKVVPQSPDGRKSYVNIDDIRLKLGIS